MAVNKVVLGTETLIDISADTVTKDTLAEGVTAHNSAGELIVGEHTCDIPETVELATPSLSVNKSTGEVTATVAQTSGGVVQAGSTKSERLELGVPRSNTSMIVTANDSTDTISISAENKQPVGYVTDATSKTASTSITLSVNGNTVTATATSGENVSKSVASVERAGTTISVTENNTAGKLTITAANDQAGGYVTGANKTATTTVTLSASGASVTATTTEGKKVSKSVSTATQATPTISVSGGTITASCTQTAGYVTNGTKKASKAATELDTYLKAANIKSGVTIFGVKGEYSGGTGGSGEVKYHSSTTLPSPACSSVAYYEIPLYYSKDGGTMFTGSTFYILVDLKKKKLAYSENNRLQITEPSVDFSSYSFDGVANGYLLVTYTGSNLLFTITNSNKCEVDGSIWGFAV